MLKYSKTVIDDAGDYVPAVIEACRKGGDVEPIDFIVETANYPKVLKLIDMAEFTVGFFHGVASQLDAKVELVWRELAAMIPAEPAPKAKGKAAPKAKAAKVTAPKREPRGMPAAAAEQAVAALVVETPACGVRPARNGEPCLHPAGHVAAGQKIHSNGHVTWSDRKPRAPKAPPAAAVAPVPPDPPTPAAPPAPVPPATAATRAAAEGQIAKLRKRRKVTAQTSLPIGG